MTFAIVLLPGQDSHIGCPALFNILIGIYLSLCVYRIFFVNLTRRLDTISHPVRSPLRSHMGHSLGQRKTEKTNYSKKCSKAEKSRADHVDLHGSCALRKTVQMP